VSIDEEPVAEEVDEVGGDENKGDRADVMDSLEIAAEAGIEEEQGEAENEDTGEGDGVIFYGGSDAEEAEERGESQDGGGERGSDGEGEDEGGGEGAAGGGEVICAEGLGDEGVEAGHESDAEDGEGIKGGGTEAGGADGGGGMGELADHDVVDDGHDHPAELGAGERDGDAEHFADVETQFGCHSTFIVGVGG